MIKEYASLKPYLKKYALRYFLGIICLAITNGGVIYIPQLLKRAIDLISRGETDQTQIGRIMLLMVGVAFVVALSRLGWRHFVHGASRRIEAELRGRLFDRLVTLDRSFYSSTKTGDIMARATNDMNAVRMATGMTLIAFLDGLFMTLFILIILFGNYPRLTWILITPLPLVTLLILRFGPMLGKRFKAVQSGFSDISDRAQENLSGLRLIQTYRREEYAMSRFSEVNENYRKANLALVRIWGLFHPLIMFFAGVITFLLILFGGKQVLLGNITPGDFVAIMSYMGMLIWPMMGVGMVVNWLQRGGVALERINAILDREADIRDYPEAEAGRATGDLVLDHLNYTYPDGEVPVLKDIDLTIKKGMTLGILGPTGSGKTTLIKLLPRLLESDRGKISFGGRELHRIELEELRSAFSLVPQTTFLFSDTVRNNIAFGKPDATQEEVEQAARISTIDRDMENFPQGYETVVGEKGVTLSGGQKQRTALSRALMLDREVMILDDSLSAVDTKTEEFILNHFRESRKGKTNIIVSHRYTTLQKADLILVMEEGRIADRGTHEELIGRDGFYREIYDLQRLEEAESREVRDEQ
ncbi:MAG: ABC transporter ATP-binding protein [Spirochaetales bacterium]|nr:ABC transporter ATP-binding protein [Spirochaetales bacterium]